MKRFLRSALRTSGLIAPLRDAVSLLSAPRREALRRERADVARLAGMVRRPLRIVPAGAGRKALMVSFQQVRQIQVMVPVLLAMQKAGYEPVPLAGARLSAVSAAYRHLGVETLAYHEDYAGSDDGLAEAGRIVAECSSLFDLLPLERHQIAVGRFAVATVLRQLRTAEVDLTHPASRAVAVQALAESLVAADRVCRLLDDVRPDLVVFPDRGYTPEGQLFDAALARGIPCMTWNVAHRENALVLKRYHAGNKVQHFSTLSAKSWDFFKSMPWTDGHWRQVFAELDHTYRSGQWYAEVGTQFNKVFPEREALVRQLGLDPARKTAVLFPHIFWDATFFWGVDVFTDYKEWFVEALKAACANDHLNWLVKIHPAHLVKQTRDGHQGLTSEEEAIREAIGTLPPHVKLLPPDVDISTWSLFAVMDYCLTVRGTVGIEAAMLGKRTLTCGTGRYDRHGFTLDYQDRDTYLADIARLHEIPPPTDHEVELARRFAYGLFVARSTPITCARIQFARDAGASLEVGPRVATPEEAAAAPDVAAIAAWLDSGDEDYLDAAALAPRV